MKRFYFLFLALTFSISAKTWSPQEVLRTVNQSPYFVDRHDKEGWLGIFAPDAYIEDPVGGYRFEKDHFVRKFQQHEAGMFWDAFIAKNVIFFDIKEDLISGLTVVRDADVHATIPEANATVVTPAHLQYTLKEVDGKLMVKSLEAYWHMPSVTKETLARGKVGQKIMSVQMGNIFSALGTNRGLNHFLKASVVGTHHVGQKKLEKLVNVLKEKKHSSAKKLFIKKPLIEINGETLSLDSFLALGHSLENLSKLISSGHTVSANAQWKSKKAFIVVYFKHQKIERLEILY